ncbi:hypothetical protein O181_105566 [Austropuccinia psidii MF-1]|uniref:Uncharacterized protein n=1 Tax=Austropuccinia psidii MF-1 TaxID=1389203 RepID=A0A9Q3PME6_9BASI|nr:hypothetical protein [Austropuccinia psidii MF-1]
METAIESSQMDVYREEERPGPDLESLPQERHVWRIPELPPIPQVPDQNLVQRSQGRGVGNIPKPLEGGYELLLTHQEYYASGEDHRNLRRMEPVFLKRESQKDKELVEEQKFIIHIPEGRVGNVPSFGEGSTSGIKQLQNSSRSVQGQSQRTSE